MLYGKYKRCVLFGLGSHNHHKKGFFHSHNSVNNIVKHMGKKVLVKNFSEKFQFTFCTKTFSVTCWISRFDDSESQEMFDRVCML